MKPPRAGPPHAHKEGHEAESDEDCCAGDHPRRAPLEPRPPRASARTQGSSRERRFWWAGPSKNGNSAERTRLRSRCAPRRDVTRTSQDSIENHNAMYLEVPRNKSCSTSTQHDTSNTPPQNDAGHHTTGHHNTLGRTSHHTTLDRTTSHHNTLKHITSQHICNIASHRIA